MIEEKDRYRAPATYKTARLADIPAGNSGQETDPTDKFTEPLQVPPAEARPDGWRPLHTLR
jgi:hypothetical protein